MIARIERNRECLETMGLKLDVNLYHTVLQYGITNNIFLDMWNNENIQYFVFMETYHHRKEVIVYALRPKR